MARIKLHHDIFGRKSGETIDVDADKAKWAVTEGYASTSTPADGVHATSVPAKQDPRLPENAEGEPNVDLRQQIADGLMLTPDTDEDANFAPTLAHPENYHSPELYNSKGDPEKGEKGKQALEAKAEAADPDEAVEVTGDTAPAAAENDKVEAAAVEADEDETVTAPEEPVVEPEKPAAKKAAAKKA
jgi:hypothetical protein